MAELPNRIRELRNARGWSLDFMAGEVGCSKVQLADLELGKRRLSTYWMERIAPVLKVEIPELLRDDQNPFRLTAQEMQLIERFRAGTEADRDTVMRVTEAVLPFRANSEKAA